MCSLGFRVWGLGFVVSVWGSAKRESPTSVAFCGINIRLSSRFLGILWYQDRVRLFPAFVYCFFSAFRE